MSARARAATRVAVTVAASLLASLIVPGAAKPAAAAGPVYPVPSSGSWTVDGAGFGHGIGLSQWGAQGAALQGLTANQIISFYYPGTTPGFVGNNDIRVQLTRYAGGTIVFGAYGGEQLVATDLATGRAEALPASSRYLLTLDASAMHLSVLTSSGWSQIALNGSTNIGGPIDVRAPNGTWLYSSDLSGAGRQYFGTLRLVRTAAGAAQAVNILSLDAYLKFVVPRESPSSWQPEALRAQAIAARSYALAVSNPTGQWDICDTDQCQVYGGRAVTDPGGTNTTWLEAASTSAAVDGTSGVVPSYGGSPAFTQFSSSNGGYSVAGSKPYLVAQADPYSGAAPGDPASRWRSQLSAATMQQRCPSGGTLLSFEITGRDGMGPFGGRITSIKLNCSTGSTSVTGPDTLRFGLKSNMWLPAVDVVGNLETLTATAGGVRFTGWAAGVDGSRAVITVLYGAGQSLSVDADRYRPDVAAAYPALGPNRGFDSIASAPPGMTTACVFARGSGGQVQLGCASLNLPAGAPFGHLDSVQGTTGGVSVSGWTIDPDTDGPIDVHLYNNGVATPISASLSRPDVGAAFPQSGSAHGFATLLQVAPGTSGQVCAYAINVPAPSANPTLGCARYTVPDAAPIGNSEVERGGSGGVHVSGWALDPDTSASSDVRVRVDSRSFVLSANQSRPDIAAAFPGAGPAHGYDAVLPSGSGDHTVCIDRINIGPGPDVAAGCATVSVPAGAPIGTLDRADVAGSVVTAVGWAIDPDTTGPISVQIYLDGAPTLAAADQARPDVGSAFPASGPNHGFRASIQSSVGRHSLCVFAVNTPTGENPWLGCATVTIS